MARPREFDSAEVLERAMRHFWARGYEAASLNDLQRAMGISRQSLYNTFGDKHRLLLSCLVLYRERATRGVREQLEQAGTLRVRIQRLFDHIIEAPLAARRQGCLFIKVATERAGRDLEALRLIADYNRALEDYLVQAIEAAAARGEAPLPAPRRLARFLLMALQGLRALAQIEPDRALLRDVAAVALASIDGPPPGPA